MFMHHIVICGLPGSTVLFPRHLMNETIFEKKLLNTKCVFWFSLQLLSEIFLVLRRNERYMIENICLCACKVPTILVGYWWKLNFLNICFKKILKYQITRQSFQLGAELFHGDIRTDGRAEGVTKLIVVFRYTLLHSDINGTEFTTCTLLRCGY